MEIQQFYGATSSAARASTPNEPPRRERVPRTKELPSTNSIGLLFQLVWPRPGSSGNEYTTVCSFRHLYALHLMNISRALLAVSRMEHLHDPNGLCLSQVPLGCLSFVPRTTSSGGIFWRRARYKRRFMRPVEVDAHQHIFTYAEGDDASSERGISFEEKPFGATTASIPGDT